jgi:hypothetical protein
MKSKEYILICLLAYKRTKKLNSVVLVRKRTIPTKRPQPADEVSANLTDGGCRVVSATDPHGRNLGFLDPAINGLLREILEVLSAVKFLVINTRSINF